jgi:hypothetical protein
VDSREHLHFIRSTVVSNPTESKILDLRLIIVDVTQYGGQQGNFPGPHAGSPAGFPGSPMGYAPPQSAGGFGRGQQPPQGQWQQPPPGQNFNNGFGGYQS